MASSDTRLRTDHVEQAVRILHTWNPSKIRMAKLQADAGSMMLVGDLCEDLLADDTIKGTLEIRVKGLFGLPLEFDPAGDKRRTSPILKALERDWWAMNPENTLGQSWGTAILLGMSVAELTQLEHEGRVLPRLKHWNPRWLKYNWTTRTWELTTGSTTGSSIITLEPGDGKWLMFAPGGEHRPWTNGAWRSVANWWLLKQYAITDWARYSEAHGSPILAGVMPATAAGDSKARKELAADLSELGANSSVALPPGYDLKLVEATANTWQTFKAQIEMADAGIAVAILGQNLTTRVSSGSLAAASVHDQVRGDLKRSDAETISTITRTQQLVWWAEWNFGNRDLAPWARWKTDPPTDLKLEAETYNVMGDVLTKFKAAGIRLAPVLEKFGLELEPESVPVPPVQTPVNQPAPQANPQLNNLMLASGKPASSAQAFLDGQLYADALGDLALTLDVFKPNLESVLKLLANGTDYEELRSSVLATYPKMNADDLQEFMARAMILADLAGRYSASLDAASLDR